MKNQPIKIDPKMTQVIEVVGKDIEIVILTTYMRQRMLRKDGAYQVEARQIFFYENTQIELLEVKTMSEMKTAWSEIIADQTLTKKKLVNLKMQQLKLTKMKCGEKKD